MHTHAHTQYTVYTLWQIFWETVIQKEKRQQQTEHFAFLASCSRPKKEKRTERKKRREAREEKKRILGKVLRKHTWRVKDWSRRGVTYDRLGQ